MANPPTRRKDSPIYWSWQNMKRRCTNTSLKDSHRYVGRGIGYPPEWKTFEGFYADMASSYRPGLTLDRTDNDKSYSKSNCRWATMKVQSNNRGNSRLFTYKGKTRTLAQWCELVNVKPSTVRQRFYVYKWPLETALGLSKKEG